MLADRVQAHRRARPLRALCLLALASIAFEPAAGAQESADEASPPTEAETAPTAPTEHHTRQINFEGNDAVSSGDLRDHMLTQAPPWYRFWMDLPFYEDEVREDMKRLVALYRQRGYYEARADYELIYSQEDSDVTVEIEIDEGEPVELDRLRVTLADGSPPEDHELIDARKWRRMIRRLPLREGRTFRLGDYQAAREAILAWIAERGFPRAQLEGSAEVDVPSHRASVDWTLQMGPRVRFGEVDISGLDAVDRYIVEREIRLEPGEWYSVSAMAQTRRRIQNLSLFRWTIVEALPPESEALVEPAEQLDTESEGDAAPTSDETEQAEPSWPVSVRVAERRPRRIRLGGGWGTDTSFRGELSWHHRNFFGGARHMDVAIRYSGLASSFRPSFMEPYVFGTRTRFLFSPAFVRETQDAYDARRILIDAQLQRDLIERVQIRVGYRFDRNDVYSVLDNPGEDVLPEGISIITGPNLELSRSTVDNRLNATSGHSIAIEARSSVKAIGSDEDFVKYTLDARSYFDVIGTVIALRGLVGTIQNHGATDAEDIPLVERFYSGGANSMRGFAYRSLSPEDANGDSIGGSSLIEGSFEWRIPVWGPIGVVGFVDAAQVDPDPWKFQVDDLRYAAGTGVRYMTPAGPIRLDFAWRLNPPENRGKFRISASLGHTF